MTAEAKDPVEQIIDIAKNLDSQFYPRDIKNYAEKNNIPLNINSKDIANSILKRMRSRPETFNNLGKGLFELAGNQNMISKTESAKKIDANNDKPSNFRQIFEFDGDIVRRIIILNGNEYSTSVEWNENDDKHADDPVRDYFFAQLTKENEKFETSGNGKTIRYADLFSGCGGMSLGISYTLKLMGYEPELVLAADSEPSALKMLESNFPGVHLCDKDLDKVFRILPEDGDPYGTSKRITVVTDEAIGKMKGEIDLLVGGPPCQGNSIMNNHTRGEDFKNELYWVMSTAAFALDVPMVIIENVKNVKSNKEGVVDVAIKNFKKNGYDIRNYELYAPDYGIAQVRRRHFLIAVKNEFKDVFEKIDSAVDRLKLSTSLTQGNRKEFLSFDDINPVNDISFNVLDNIDVKNSNRKYPLNFPNKWLEKLVDHDEKARARINYLHENDVYELPLEMRPQCHQEGSPGHGNKYSAYKRMYGDKPSETITRQFTNFGSVRAVHPHTARAMNIREGARLQSFPDWFWQTGDELKLNKKNYCDMIGNAVPPMLMVPLIVGLFAGK